MYYYRAGGSCGGLWIRTKPEQLASKLAEINRFSLSNDQKTAEIRQFCHIALTVCLSVDD
tara:strand:+ start:387 stop:566 length:180 start_codon:yes stop_codon:yes gene_type:complete